MNSIADTTVMIQTTSQSVPTTPSWFGEVTLIIEHLRKQEVLSAMCEQVRFARRRFGRYEVIDFVAVLFGYAISGERTLETFYDHLHPFAAAFMALFGPTGCATRFSSIIHWLERILPSSPDSTTSGEVTLGMI